MPAVKSMPWAILLCRYSDDANDPATTRLSDLAAQWRLQRGDDFAHANLNPSWDTDARTVLGLYESFFVDAGLQSFNAVRYWREMSHGAISVADSVVFPCVLARTSTEAYEYSQIPGGAAYQTDTFQLAKKALLEQHGVDWKDFYAVAVSFQSPDFGAQGGWYDGGPGVFMDIRYVKNNGTEAWGQEMGHAFGLDHSRTDGVVDATGQPIDYQDPWDVMSTANAYSAPDPDFGLRGPGLNAWNMRSRSWLDESRVFKVPMTNFDSLVTLRPLHRLDLPGYLAVELPAVGAQSPYLVEFRVASNWDAAIPRPCLIVHRFDGPPGRFLGTHSYVMLDLAGEKSLEQGDEFLRENLPFGSTSETDVVLIDSQHDVATLRVRHTPGRRLGPVTRPIPWWQWDRQKVNHVVAVHSSDQLANIASDLRKLGDAVAQSAGRRNV